MEAEKCTYFNTVRKLHTTEVNTHTLNGYANGHRGEAEVSISIITECMCVKLAPKYLFSGVLRYDIEFYLRVGTEKI